MPKKILIVDDDRELAEEVAEILREEGYSVESIFDSVAAEKLIRQNTYELYLFDYKMAGLTGVDLLKSLKGKRPRALYLSLAGIRRSNNY